MSADPKGNRILKHRKLYFHFPLYMVSGVTHTFSKTANSFLFLFTHKFKYLFTIDTFSLQQDALEII